MKFWAPLAHWSVDLPEQEQEGAKVQVSLLGAPRQGRVAILASLVERRIHVSAGSCKTQVTQQFLFSQFLPSGKRHVINIQIYFQRLSVAG